MNVKRFIHIWTIAILFLLFDVNIAKAASSCPLDSVLTFNVDSVLTEVTIYDYVVDTPRTTVWTVNPDGTRVGKSREESYSSSLKTMTASYVWDNSAHTWKGTKKEEKSYKYFGGTKKQISFTTFVWLNAKWVADTRETSNFDDAAREIEHFEYSRNTTTNQLQPISGHVYAWIDDTRKSLEEIYTTYSNGAWSAGTKQEWAFDDEGRQTLYASYGTITNGHWIGDTKEEWGYTDSILTMHADYVWGGLEWEGTLKEVWEFDTIGRTTLREQYGWYNSDWSMTLREIAAFDEAGHQTLIENYTGENGVPTGIQKEEYAFDGENITLTIKYKWSATKKDWIGQSNERWEFNGPTGEKTYYEKQVWRNSAWGDSIQETWEYNPLNSKQTYHVRYSWNKDLAAMRKTLEYTTEYDGTNVIRIENYLLENEEWVGKKKETTTYTDGKKTDHFVFAWENGAWVNSNKEIWAFNTSGKQTLHEKYEYTNGGWLLVLQENIGYTGTTVTLKENYELIGGLWTGTKKEEYTYTSGKKTQELIYAWENNGWVNSTKEEWTYDAKKRETLHEKSQWENGAWVGLEKTESAYLGNTTTKTLEWIYQWSDNAWMNQTKEDWAYDASNQLTAHEKNEWVNGAWVGVEKQEYAYDGSTKTLELIYQWYGTAWMYQTREAWAFESGRQTLHEKQGWNGAEWIDMQREIAAFDEAGNQTLIENYALMNETGWTGLKKEEYTFEGGTKTTTVIYAWVDNAWTPSTKNEIGYQDGNTEVSEANYTWVNEAWKGSGNRTYTTKDSEDRVVELLTKNWPDGATEWTNDSITTHEFNADGDDILTYNGTWNGTRWTVSSMTRLDKIVDSEGRQLLKASWYCGSDSVWKGIEKDTANYSTSGKLLYIAKYKGWKNNDWIPVSKTQNTYDSNDNTLIEESFNWVNNSWQGVFRYESGYDDQGRRNSYATYTEWSSSKNDWVGSSKQEYVYYKNYTNKYESKIMYKWKKSQWTPSFLYTYTYDSSDREVLQIVQSYSNGNWINTNKYEKGYSGTKEVKNSEYAWSNNKWSLRSQKDYYYDEDAQAKLRREVLGSWTMLGLASYKDNHYNYACDLRAIRFVNYDGALLEEQKIEKGQIPVYTGETPTKSDAANTYVFLGWTPTVVAVNGDATYTATFSASLNQYTVTFKDEDGTTLSSETLYHGATPTCAEPSKQADAQYTYTFSGWTPAVTTVTANVVYTATYTLTKNKYTITWLDDDDSSLGTTTVEYGKVPTHANPTKLNTAEYTYSFAGWDNTPVAVTGDATYKATYSAVKNSYTVTWRNEDGSEISHETLEYGVTPAHEDLTKTGTAQYSYTFAGWTPALAAVKGDATYTASFIQTTNRYTVTFKDDQGTTLDSRLWDYGLTPTCTPPTKDPEDDQHTTIFMGWSPEVTSVKADATYTAVFASVLNSYTITWLDDDNSSLGTTVVDYGVVPTHAEPTKQATAEFTYTFAGWDNTPVAVTGPATYKATYTSTKNKYTITWLDDDNSSLGTTSVEYGIVPTHENPTKAATAEFTYTFAGWDNTPIAVTGPATYKATYTSAKNSYTITWLDDDNSSLGTTSVEYGVVPTHDNPTKQATAEFTYTFAGWDNTPIAVTGPATYKATYSATKNKYTITWLDDDNSSLGTTSVEYGVVPTHDNPTKQATAEFTYTFAGWDNTPIAVVGEATYKATYSATKNKYTITWLNDDNSQIDQTSVEYGVVPTHDDPAKTATAEWSYSFSGWDNTPIAVTGEATYKATYTSTKNKYTITWLDDDETQIDQTTVEYGVVPTHNDPSKAATAEFTYTFAGWDNTPIAVAGEATYKATYSAAKNSYTITWLDENESVLSSETLEYGATPTHEDPTKQPTAQYGYTFAGWNPAVSAVTGNATYKATYTDTINQYTISWLDDVGTLVDQTKVAYGTTPAHANIYKESDDQYDYTFVGWTPTLVPVTGDASYSAIFTTAGKSYTVTFYFEDGVTILDQMTLPYGAIPSTPYIPSIPSDANHTYSFSGWSPEITPVTGDISYVPTFTAIPNQYTVIFRNYNGKELQRKKVDYGTIPEYEGDEPSRPATNSYTWAFEGWTPELTAVIGDATYTAVYTKVMNTYTILFYDEDGITLLDEVTVEHGQKPTTSVVPTKEADEEYRYTFAGWSPKIAKATSDAEYIATYMATPKTQDLNNTEAEERATKVLIDDHIYILRSGHTYTLDGMLVE